MPLSLMQVQEQYPPFFEAIKREYLLLPATEERNQTHTYEVVEEENRTVLRITRLEDEKKKKMPVVFGLKAEQIWPELKQ